MDVTLDLTCKNLWLKIPILYLQEDQSSSNAPIAARVPPTPGVHVGRGYRLGWCEVSFYSSQGDILRQKHLLNLQCC